jgi:hypothetical protein
MLLAADTKTADSTGKATCSVQPLRAFENWRITNTGISSSSVNNVPTFKLYRGSESPTNLVAATYSATFNNNNDVIDLNNGERLLGVFEGADVGSVCTMNVSGDKIGRT